MGVRRRGLQVPASTARLPAFAACPNDVASNGGQLPHVPASVVRLLTFAACLNVVVTGNWVNRSTL